MVYTDNQEFLRWLEDMISLTWPDKVVWIEGDPQQIVELCGGFIMIESDPIPEDAIFVCSREKSDSTQWAEPPRMYARLLTSLSSSMKEKKMYVVPFASKKGTNSKNGILLTDSVPVIAAVSAKCRFGTGVLDEIGCYGEFIRGIHTSGNGNPCVAHFPEDDTFLAVNCSDEHAGAFVDYISRL